MLTHLALNVGKDLVAVFHLNAEHRVREGFHHVAFNFDDAVFLGHILR